MCFPNLNAIIRKKSHRENAIKGYIIKPSKTSALIKTGGNFMKRRGMALGLAALMTCTALFTTTAKAETRAVTRKKL